MSSEQSLEPTIARLQAIDGYDFENFVADLFEEDGWETRVTQDSQDGGIDVIAEQSAPFQQRAVIQAKRHSSDNKVGRPDVQQYGSLLREDYHRDMAVIVTTSAFTRGAYEYGRDYNVKLMDGAAVAGLMIAKDRANLLDEYAPHIDELDDTPEDIFPVQQTPREQYYEEKPLEFATDAFAEHSLLNAVEVIHKNRAGRALVESLNKLKVSIEEQREDTPTELIRSTPSLLDQNWFEVDISEEISNKINSHGDLSSPPPEVVDVICIRNEESVTVCSILPPSEPINRQKLAYIEDCVDFVTANYDYNRDQVMGLIIGDQIECRQGPRSKISRLKRNGFDVVTYQGILKRSVETNRELLQAVHPYFAASGDGEMVEKLEELTSL